MVIKLNKKYLALFVACLLISGLAYNVKNSQRNEISVVETVALPVTKKVIVLDAGHGKPDEGAESSTRHNRSGK